MIGLGRSLGIGGVAEGVETAQQARLLAQWGGDLGQGYLIAKPMHEDRIPDFLRSRAEDNPLVLDHGAFDHCRSAPTH